MRRIKYSGSLHRAANIFETVLDTIEPSTVVDAFSGTSSLGIEAKRKGAFVTAVDYMHTAYAIAKAKIETSAGSHFENEVKQYIQEELATVDPKDGWFVDKYCRQSRFFSESNAKKIQAVREKIEEDKDKDERLYWVAITSLMEAADSVDSSAGVYSSIKTPPSARFFNKLELEVPLMLKGEGKAVLGRSEEIVKDIPADLLVLDPPARAGSHKTLHHLTETLVKFDNPETEGVVNRPVYKKGSYLSPFYSKRSEVNMQALSSVINPDVHKACVLFYPEKAFVGKAVIENILTDKYGHVDSGRFGFRRYLGASVNLGAKPFYNMFVASEDRDVVREVIRRAFDS